jgi:hypothetical protein
VRKWYQVPHRLCAEILAAPESSRRTAQRSLQLQNLTILIVTCCGILKEPPLLQMLSEACENALEASESTGQSSSGGGEHLDIHRCTGMGNRSIRESSVLLRGYLGSRCWY